VVEPGNRQILVVEDDPDIAGLVALHMRDLHFHVHVESDGRSGLREALSGKYDVVIQDLMLPGMDGMDVCREVRKADLTVPILMLTARTDEMDKILGLELGADDYLTKPFSIRELVARVKALIRRSGMNTNAESDVSEGQTLHFGTLQIDLGRRRADLDGRMLDLTAKEWELLVLFATSPGRIYSRQELLDLVWGYQYDGYSHTVNSHINRLRGKIESIPAEPRFIVTKRGLGYLFAGQNDKDATRADQRP